MSFPKALTSIHQIECSSRCNLRCVYCPSKDIVDGKYSGRTALDISREHFVRALEWVKYFVRAGTQHEVNLAGIGESTLHKEFVAFVRLAREAIPDGVLTFATNGLIHDEAMIASIAPYRPQVWVSLHRPEKAGPAIQVYRKYGLIVGVSGDPSLNANNWAGQVNWFDSGGARFECPWMKKAMGFVMADGRLSSCCIDAQGIGVIGHVNDEIGSVKTQPYALCKTCYQTVEDEHWDQKNGVAK